MTSAAATIPRLSDLLGWPTEHLTDAADSWETVGERSYGVTNRVWCDALSVGWQGEAADALRSVTHADMTTAGAVADQLQADARVARSGASDLDAARSRVRYAVEDARSAGFDVGEDLSVTDRMSGASAALRAARQAEAETLAGDIRQCAANLIGVDEQVAAKITAAVDGIRQSFPPSPALDAPRKDNHVQAVDRHWKEDPSPPPGPDADAPWRQLPPPKTWEDVRKVLLQMDQRKSRPNRQLNTPEDIRDFCDWLLRGAVRDMPHSGDFPRKQLEDGTEIQLRPGSKSQGPVVDVTPPAGPLRKVHLPLPFVNDLPELPALGEHRPSTLLPLPDGHPPPASVGPTQFADPADVPPWLKDPSPPGFAVSPVQPPPVFDWDGPEPPPQSAQQQGSPPHGGSSWLPQIGLDLSDAGEKAFGWLIVGGIVVGSLWGIGQQGGEVPAS